MVSDVPIATIVNKSEIKRTKLLAKAIPDLPITISIDANINVFLTPKMSTNCPKMQPDIEIARL